jgi:hypothetical protein
MPQPAGLTACGAIALLVAITGPRAAAAQARPSAWDRVLPGRTWFRSPVADPLEARLAAGLLRTDVLSRRGPEREPFTLADPADARSDLEAAVVLGVTPALYDIAVWRGGGLLLTGNAALFARFRVEYSSRDEMAHDWVAGGGVEARHRAWSGRLRVQHRSSHLGDEFAQSTGATRIEFGGESVELLASYSANEVVRLYGGGSWLFHSTTEEETVLAPLGRRDRWTVQAGADAERYPWARGRVGFRAGVDWQAAQRTSWRGAIAAAAGLTLRGRGSFALLLRYFDGPSTMGEFFLTDESYWALELSTVP